MTSPVPAADGLDRQQVIDRYGDHYNPMLALLFELAPCPIEQRSGGMYLYDDENRPFLDFACGYGVFSVGHRNPRVQAAVLEQIQKMSVCPPNVANPAVARLADRLTGLMPDDLKRVYFAGSGSEAIELGLRIARMRHPDRRKFVAADHGFHGKTLGAVGVCGQDYLRVPFGPLWEDDAIFVPYGDYEAMERAVDSGVAAVLLEPVLGGGYVTTAPEGYLPKVRELCDRTGTLLLLDEVQTGFGRTGDLFAFMHEGVLPDIMIITKGMTGGHVSIAGTLVRQSVLDACEGPWDDDPLAYASESTGWPVVCAAAAAAIDFVMDEDLPARARELGPYLQDGLRRVQREYPKLVLDVPGRGLMTGAKLRSNLVENALWLGMLKRRVITGLSTNPIAKSPVMRFFPPLVVEREHIDECIATFREACAELDRMPGPMLDLAGIAARLQYKLPKPVLRALLRTVS